MFELLCGLQKIRNDYAAKYPPDRLSQPVPRRVFSRRLKPNDLFSQHRRR